MNKKAQTGLPLPQTGMPPQQPQKPLASGGKINIKMPDFSQMKWPSFIRNPQDAIIAVGMILFGIVLLVIALLLM